ncbi:unnamed protein product [Prorocentrum cordatum]|uniref:Uncharacterized protein n=1 Tax=Prorocentrum cordatum TaxID=2364126 RepID=A0ABN9PLQ6_9DINO|nr:unnamed protein product [Polarella glacialis]
MGGPRRPRPKNLRVCRFASSARRASSGSTSAPFWKMTGLLKPQGGYSTDDVWKSRRWRLRRPRWEARAGHGARQGRPGGDGSQAHSALRLAGRVQPRTCGPSSASCSGRSSPPASAATSPRPATTWRSRRLADRRPQQG